MPWRGPAGEARHTGVTILLWEREGKALGVPAYQEKEPVRLQHLQTTEPAGSLGRLVTQQRHPCDERSQPDALRPDLWAIGRRALRDARAPAGQPNTPLSGKPAQPVLDLRNSRSIEAFLVHAPDRYPEGQDHRLGSRERIERVAVRQH